MKCPHCGVECNALVLETRKQDDAIIRKRACGPCGRFFLSKEVPDLTVKMSRPRPDRVRGGAVEPGPKAINRDAFTVWR